MMKKLVSAPYLLWMAIFIIVPLIMVAYFALTDTNGAFTLDNLAAVSQYSNIFIRSIWLAAVATVICLIIAYPLALILANTDKSYQSTVLMIVMLPMWMNFLLRTYAWMTLLGNNGLINSFFGLFGLGPFKMLNTSGAVVLGMVYNYLPYMILPLYTVMEIMSGITMVFVPAISTFIISRMLGGGSNLLIGDLIEMQFLGNSYNPNLGAAISLVLMVIILLIMTILNQFDDDEDKVLM